MKSLVNFDNDLSPRVFDRDKRFFLMTLDEHSRRGPFSSGSYLEIIGV